MRKLLAENVIIIGVVSIITYFIYVWILNYTQSTVLQNQIVLAYVINTTLAMGIMLCMFLLKKRFKDQLAFIFMLGSFIKFGCFFIFFYPVFNSDGNVTRIEFFSFFIPYAICLVSETVTTIRILNKLDAK
ncbi:hypothetical protein VP395_08900 [Mariniflexile soesokkakense]|uniref:Uncharacterized protein n=1 Tax=Mariniflexile soesokkakense TaxID=1343160 RepID=A0ABV0A9R6_9FLAO